MNLALKNKLQKLQDRVEELNQLLADPKTISKQEMFRKLSIELSEVEPIVTEYQMHQELGREINETETIFSA